MSGTPSPSASFVSSARTAAASNSGGTAERGAGALQYAQCSLPLASGAPHPAQ
jgi:hypothetical protein